MYFLANSRANITIKYNPASAGGGLNKKIIINAAYQ